MQFQADVLGVPVLLPEISETTALGAASLAGVGGRAVVAGSRRRRLA
jgi:glycerol kinase